MSHGGEGHENEPNLTPLLDLVLQLVMFFMINANFVMEQVSKDVELPTASMARPQESKERETGPVFLNIVEAEKYLKSLSDKKNRETDERRVAEIDRILKTYNTDKIRDDALVLVTGKDPLTPAQLATYLKSEFNDAKRRSGKEDPPAVIIVRADRSLKYKHVFKIMSVCKAAGYKNLQLRALRGTTT
jgi:biopolymer transport protein ExbD